MDGSNNTDKPDIYPFFGEREISPEPATEERLESRPSLEKRYDFYDTTNKYRGLALVFCNIEFSSFPKRDGAERDRADICDALEKLSFDVKVFVDLKRRHVMKTLKKWSRKKQHVKSDSLVVVVMSYGEKGFIYAKDQQYEPKALHKYFVGDKCPSLIGKPKLFFMQTCPPNGQKSKSSKNDHASKPKIDCDNSNSKTSYFIPTTADLLIMYNGENSWKDIEKRSCFIQSLCKELNDNNQNRELLTLLTRVIRRTVFGYKFSEPNNNPVQVPCILSMLTKSFHFYEKKESENGN